MKPGRVNRVLQILTALQSGVRYGTSDLRKMFNVSKRTLFRDLKELANAGVPYRYDPDNCTYEVSREFFLPPLGLSLKFDIHEYLGRAWSMEPEGRIYNIKLRFLPETADEVAGVQWHSTQAVNRNDDGSATIQFRVDGLSEITWWILGFGDKVQVLAPAVLKKRIARIAKNVVKNNTHLVVKP